jgi:hypothetical protein
MPERGGNMEEEEQNSERLNYEHFTGDWDLYFEKEES